MLILYFGSPLPYLGGFRVNERSYLLFECNNRVFVSSWGVRQQSSYKIEAASLASSLLETQHIRVDGFGIMSIFAAIWINDGSLSYVKLLLYYLLEGGIPLGNGCPQIENNCDKVKLLLTKKLVELDIR
jgi:hypothetical protein